MFDGHSLVWNGSVMEWNGSTTDLNYILYKGNCFRYEDIREDYDIEYYQVYRVMSRAMFNRLDTAPPHRRITNKVKRYYRQIEQFREHVLMKEQFRTCIPVHKEWRRMPDEYIFRTNRGNNKLVFGGGHTALVPIRGLRDYKPYRKPADHHFRIFSSCKKTTGRRCKRYGQARESIERLVIHFYKRMSYAERKPILRMLPYFESKVMPEFDKESLWFL